MALINCSECGKVVSNKAISCPNCGNPINQIVEINNKNEELLKFPELPINLEIGKQIINFGGNAAFDGFYDPSENLVSEIPSGNVKILNHTHGLKVTNGLYMDCLKIHNSQIISLKQTSHEELLRQEKSVIGRAVVGGLILGPFGAIIGGMSGIGSKEKFVNKHYFVINYWDIETKTAQTLLISGDEKLIQIFIEKHEKEKIINETENRKPEKETPTLGIIAIIVIIIVILVVIFSA